MKNRFLLGLLALLGFSGCELLTEGGDEDGDGDVVMYGVVRSAFVVKGTVTDADQNPLKGIRVILKIEDERFGGERFRDTVFTDYKGEFETGPEIQNPLSYVVIASDVDGPENGGEFAGDEKPFVASGGNFDYDEGVYVNEMNFMLTEQNESDEND